MNIEELDKEKSKLHIIINHSEFENLEPCRKSLWENFYVWVLVDLEFIGSDEWDYKYTIQYLPREHWDDKRRATSFETIDSFRYSGGATYSGAWHTPEEALREGLKKALTLI